jgi:hypothetical protein
MAWAIHGSVNSREAEGKPLAQGADYAGVVAALLDAGAKVPVKTFADLRDDLSENVRQLLAKLVDPQVDWLPYHAGPVV